MRRAPMGKEAQSAEKDRNFVTALARGLEILRCFGPSDDYLGNAELAKRTNIPRPTVSRMTATLTQLGYLRYVERLEKYRLGPGVLDLGYRYLAGEGVRDIARPFMQDLADATDCMVAIAAPNGPWMSYIQVCQGSGPLVLRLTVGSRVPMAGSAVGRAYLAGLSEEDRATHHRLIREHDPEGWPEWEKGLERAYREYEEYGFCTSDGEWNRDISAVGVPLVLDNDSTVIPFNCGGSSLRLSRRILVENLGPRLKELVGQVKEMLQGRDV
ncbi:MULTISPECIES: IclR family transcriptional regulator [Alloalcanivorax]|jgi:DNA-binding IclR family transcriptional regulator|uniref:IclR family transcriptional regulator n=2 Tax=Alloalcanivorax TaxID=3020832 RepID=A0A9Q3W4C4_9GAMM|nr:MULTISPECIES: IclR family transcriptional regulator [Alloalcanivorax]KYZ87140.1 IclR family transcriptional regulator [Alcanivorax sp. KX64203]ARB45328.1 IclR family transcriptional regulator [Alloalcanivorax xenomutans]MCE7507582.1 IclR family transcriptional regulator [Alloalcanivorax xenomutans]MCE7524728.1 IclR family transcriptional regulator [Alloalcanivorax xenomutans]WOA32995.1 IclR family transcriptional regulator [Alloalcanivorax xenomutans]